MNKTGPILIIEDDSDDREMLKRIFATLNFPNEIIFLIDGETAYNYLATAQIKPFLILSDINMPKLNGLELKDEIEKSEELKLRFTPYIFFSTSSSKETVLAAYSKSIQGYFVKPAHIEDLEYMIKSIINYWLICQSPNDVI